MASYNFRKDLKKSEEAIEALIRHFGDKDMTVEVLGRKEQHLGDIRIYGEPPVGQVNAEVKYDIMAKKTGNLCFEMSNGTKMTGVMTTEADTIYYVVPNGTGKVVYTFEPEKLREYIQKPENVTIKNGGDKWKFVLALVPIDKIIEDELASSIFRIEDA